MVESNDQSAYEMMYSVTDPPGPCIADRFEPNDSIDEATSVESGVFTWLRLCPEDPQDMFVIQMESFEHLTVMTSHQEGLGFTDLEIRNPFGEILNTVFDYFEGASLEIVALEPGPYQVRVLPYLVSDTLGYDLSIWVD